MTSDFDQLVTAKRLNSIAVGNAHGRASNMAPTLKGSKKGQWVFDPFRVACDGGFRSGGVAPGFMISIKSVRCANVGDIVSSDKLQVTR